MAFPPAIDSRNIARIVLGELAEYCGKVKPMCKRILLSELRYYRRRVLTMVAGLICLAHTDWR